MQLLMGDSVACGNDVLTFSAKGNYDSLFSWSTAGGTFLSSYVADTAKIRWQNSGNYLLRLTKTNSYGCKDSGNLTVRIKPQPYTRWTASLLSTGTYSFSPDDTALASYR